MKTFNIEVKHIQDVVTSFYVTAESEEQAMKNLKKAFEEAPRNIFTEDTTEVLSISEEAQMSFMFEPTPNQQVH